MLPADWHAIGRVRTAGLLVLLTAVVSGAVLPALQAGIVTFVAVIVGLALALGAPLLVALVLAALISEIFVASVDIGPFSARVYLLTVALGLVLARALVVRESPLRSGEARRLGAIYLVFVLWALANRVYQAEPPASIAYRIGATHLLALMVFVVTQAALRRRRDIALLAGSMALTTVLSGSFAILQWLGLGWTWDLALMLHPGDTPFQTAWERLIYRHSSRWGVVPGLASYSLPLSFHLVSFGMFVLTWTVYKLLARRPLLDQLIGLAGLLVLVLALVLSQSRAALLGGLVALTSAVGYTIRRQGSVSRAAAVRAGVGVSVVLAFAGLVYSLGRSPLDPSASAGQGRYSLGLIFRVADDGRFGLWRTALEFGAAHPLLGGGPVRFNELLGVPRDNISWPMSAHNMFLNALVLYGLPAVLLLLLLLTTVYLIGRRALLATVEDPGGNWIALGAILGLIAYVTCGQFHPESFTSGGTLPWWLLGVLCALLAQVRGPTEPPAVPGPPRTLRTPAESRT